MPLTLNQVTHAIGYFQMFLSRAQAGLDLLHNPDSTAQQKQDAKDDIKNEMQKMGKLFRTICTKMNYMPDADEFTNQDLTDMRIS